MSQRALPLFLLLAACGGSPETATGNDDLTGAAAAATVAPAILAGAFFDKPTSEDQSDLGIIVAPGVAVALGATSGALPSRTTLDHQPLAAMKGTSISLGEDRFGLMLDFAELPASPGWRLVGRAVPPQMNPDDMKEGLACQVVGTDMDMYASVAPKLLALPAKIEQVRRDANSWHAIARTTTSTGGEGSILVCNGKVAGIEAGGGSQGTTFEFRSLDATLLAAIAKARATECHKIRGCTP